MKAVHSGASTYLHSDSTYLAGLATADMAP